MDIDDLHKKYDEEELLEVIYDTLSNANWPDNSYENSEVFHNFNEFHCMLEDLIYAIEIWHLCDFCG